MIIIWILSLYLAFYVGQCATDIIDSTRLAADRIISANPILSFVSHTARSIPNPLTGLTKRFFGSIAVNKSSTDKSGIESDIAAHNNSETTISRFRFDVHIDAGIHINPILPTKDNLTPKPSIGVSLLSYGPSKRVTNWRFVRLGIGGLPQTGAEVMLSPVMYNIGKRTPIISNTYIHAHIGYNFQSKSIIGGVGLSLSF